MKLDKETVIKHQFWFLLGGYFLIWFIGVLVLWIQAPSKINEAKTAYKKADDGVKNELRSPVNRDTFLPPWNEEARVLDSHKQVIWKDAWNWQADMYGWPEYLRSRYNMTSPQTVISTDDLNRYRHDLYPQQIDDLRTNAPRWLEPVELQGGFDSVFKPMKKEDWHETPTREEIWLAQEDIWVKRELLVVVWDAMSRQAIMLQKPIDEKAEPNPDPEHIKARYRFANKNWEITLNLRANDKGTLVIGGDSTIKNIHPSGHPQPLTSAKGGGIKFVVAQDQVRQAFEVRGEPVNHGETRPFHTSNYDPLDGITWDKDKIKEHPIFVSQGFDQTNSPIRRIDEIELGKQDCRTVIWPLQPNHVLAELDALPEDPNKAPEAAPTGGGAGGGGGDVQQQMQQQMQMQKQMMGGAGMMGGGGAGSSSGNPTTNNQIERNRYLQPKDQDKKLNPPSRHLPLAMQLIVEQSHINDFLVSLANSRLRFQITQVDFRHVKDYIPQSEGDKKGDKNTPPGMGGYFMGMGGMGGSGGGGGMQQRMQEQIQKQRQMMGGTGGPDRGQMQQQMQQQMQIQQRMMGGAGGPPGGKGFGPMMMGSQLGGAMGPTKLPSLPGSPGAGRGNLLAGAGATDSKQSGPNQSDDNVVELTIYGIATLYRFPDQPKTTEQQPGQSGTPTPAPAPSPSGAGGTPSNTTQSATGTTTPQNGSPQPATGTGAAPTQDKSTPPGTAKTPSDPAKPADAKQSDKPAEKQPAAPKPAPPPAGPKG